MTTESARYFDSWYANMAESPLVDQIQRRHLGLPPELPSTSLLTWDGLAEVTEELRLAPGRTLLDLACGRGGYGLEIASRTGAKHIGVDHSAVAIDQARRLADDLGREAEFRVGEFTATGLGDGSVDRILCIDSIQFADPPADAFAELRRILVPGGRVVLTCWEPRNEPSTERHARLARVNLAAELDQAGFAEVSVLERTEWQAAERAMWEEAAALDPGDDPALRSFHDEGMEAIQRWGSLRRVLATATAP
ncbi:class I SAM-dependent methyltransferase [Microlunatus parietis]|uniref:Ubiquinone/menaquinone biosynthesis C-methylase UbiE n=1 Tax=Microlunatus parietis TaxID=682979 RepID=A0A7Y9I5J2_9ACTN|nr:class I SAM-dependent methyltransferase [Microlunatus parietis]NYE70659.1 ubiquinone/menaquinone biosynthesis C-methylase UbiE [Microlunatus parietis]